MFYVYEWYDTDTNIVFYVGKGCNKRYKVVAGRNKQFLDYHATHNVDVRIVKYFDSEEQSFQYEEYLIKYYKALGQCFCNLDYGGNGGVASIWTEEMRKRMSEQNPMKSEEQRLRMSVYNPMKNPEVVEKYREKNNVPVIINGQLFASTRKAAQAFNVTQITIERWCHRGYDTNGNPCRYSNKEQTSYNFRTTSSKQVLIDGTYLYPSVKAAAESIGGNSSNMIKAIKGNRPYKGHICEYANQQPSQEKSK